MTDSKQELDEIFTKYTKQVIDMCHGNRPDVADESAKAKQAIIDWHNKQTEELLDRLESQSRRADECTDDTLVVKMIRVGAERDRLNKLKESK